MEDFIKNQEQKTDGVGFGIGAFVGVVTSVFAGTALQGAETAEVEAPEKIEESSEPTPVVYPHVVFHTTSTPETPEPSKPEPPKPEPPKPEPSKPESPEPEPPTPDPDEPAIRIIKVETVTVEDGTTMTVAEVTLNGFYGKIVDVDNDGIADFACIDSNNDGIITENETSYIGESMISMQALQQAAENSNYLAHLDGPDYINDANVSGYVS